MFIPFELNDENHFLNLCDIDPHLKFYNSLNQFTSKCNYFLESSFNLKKNARGTEHSFSLCHLNIRSLKQNSASLDNYLSLLNITFTVIDITETSLQDYNCELYSFQGYHSVERHRTDRIGGGVAICIAEQLNLSVRHDLSIFDPEMESILVEVEGNMLCKNFILSVNYRPPNTDISVFNANINRIMDVTKKGIKLCYMMRDHNINILNYDFHAPTGEFVDTMFSYAFVPLINRPT